MVKYIVAESPRFYGNRTFPHFIQSDWCVAPTSWSLLPVLSWNRAWLSSPSSTDRFCACIHSTKLSLKSHPIIASAAKCVHSDRKSNLLLRPIVTEKLRSLNKMNFFLLSTRDIVIIEILAICMFKTTVNWSLHEDLSPATVPKVVMFFARRERVLRYFKGSCSFVFWKKSYSNYKANNSANRRVFCVEQKFWAKRQIFSQVWAVGLMSTDHGSCMTMPRVASSIGNTCTAKWV